MKNKGDEQDVIIRCRKESKEVKDLQRTRILKFFLEVIIK